MRKFLMWFLLLNKRLYKKATFIIILALIPIAVLALSIVAKEESGIINIALASNGQNEQVYADVVKELKKGSKLVNFIECDSADDAYSAVVSGKTDAAWIFNKNLRDGIHEFADGFSKHNSVATVIVREQNVATHLSCEKLSGVLYKYVSRDFYINYINQEVDQLNNLSESELLMYYDDFELDGKLFVFDNPVNTLSKNEAAHGFITAPIRGLLAIIVVICGFAAAMFYLEDDVKGTFSWVKQNRKIFVRFACVAIAVLNISIVMLLSMIVAGVNVNIQRELLSLLLFILCCSAFCVLISQIFSKVYVLGSLIPILTVIMFVVCPVFFDLGFLRKIQFVFPPTYYINSVYNNQYYLYAIIYFAVCAVVSIAINFAKQIRITKK